MKTLNSIPTKTLLIAPDSFKGSISATQFCQIVSDLVQQQAWPIQVLARPMSDGGEGFVDAFVTAGLAEPVYAQVQDPLGREIQAKFAWQARTQTAMIEMAQASGLPLLAASERNLLKASSFGTGQLIQQALTLGAQKIVLGLGGSATNDGGAGALQALGFQLLNALNQPIQTGAIGLSELAKIRFQAQEGLTLEQYQNIEWVIACDVTNPLLGPQGATAVFGPQKGLKPAHYPLLESCLSHFAEVTERTFKRPIRHLPGAGAAGGMAGGFVGFLNAKLVSGFGLLADLLALDPLFTEQRIDLVITAEGKIDAQTLFGKLPAQIAWMAQSHQVPCVGICGKLEASLADLPMFSALVCIHESLPANTPLEELLALTPHNLQQTLIHYLPIWLKLKVKTP